MAISASIQKDCTASLWLYSARRARVVQLRRDVDGMRGRRACGRGQAKSDRGREPKGGGAPGDAGHCRAGGQGLLSRMPC